MIWCRRRQKISFFPKKVRAIYCFVYTHINIVGIHTGLARPGYTVRRRLTENDLKARRPARIPTLTVRHKQRRIEFEILYQNWEVKDWRRVLFSTNPDFVCVHRRVDTEFGKRWERFFEATMVQEENFLEGL